MQSAARKAHDEIADPGGGQNPTGGTGQAFASDASSAARGSALGGLIPVIAMAALLVGHAVWYGFLSDDALIIARYARNVVRGNGWVFNVGERVEGYTSFLWVALAAGLGAIGVDYVTAIRALSLTGAIGCVVLLYRMSPLAPWGNATSLADKAAVQLNDAPAVGEPVARLLAPLLLASSGVFACWGLGGLEACGFAFLILLAVQTAARLDDKPAARSLNVGGARPRMAGAVGAGLAAAACALVRPEGLVVALIIWGRAVLGLRARRVRVALAYGLPILSIAGAHLCWRRFYYSDWLPNTFYVKVGTQWEQVERGFHYVSMFMAEHGGIVAWIVPIAAPWIIGDGRLARTVSIVAAALMAGVVLVGGDGLPMYRFMVPVLPLWAWLVSRLVICAVDRARRTTGQDRPRVALGFSGLVIVALAIGLAVPDRRGFQYLVYADQLIEIRDWTAAGEWLAAHAEPDATVACAPIGAIGYYSDLHVYDILGLTDKHIARKEMPLGAGWAGHEKHDAPYILSRRPRYLLLGNVQVLNRPLAANNPYFVRPPAPAIRRREEDFFTPELPQRYEPKIAELSGDRYLHFLRRIDGK